MSDFSQPKLNYRSDIDGLRAVAVLLVVANHFRLWKFDGGYVGVDVFFVISGYLISSIILSQIANSTFSIISFYERRIRRIVPALLGMMLATCILCYFYFLPTELEDFAKSLIAATFSFSNILFWSQAGYFDGPSHTKPLLHTWSLGVEEQFYIFFPLVLVLARRLFPRRLRLVVLGMAAVSFVWSVAGAYRDPTATFFLAHTRAWELLTGTIISMRILPELKSRAAREIASLAGLGMIAYAGIVYSPTTPFPGLAALPPVLGAGLIIAAGQAGESVVSKLLSLKPVVFVGLISYSLYLWHWPVVVFQSVAGILGGGGTGRDPKLIGVGVSLLLGYLSWRFIEIPFRGGKLKLSGKSLFSTAGLGVGVVTALALMAIFTHGFKSRYSPEAIRVAAYLQYKSPFREGRCFITTQEKYSDFAPSECLKLEPTKKNYLLVGDSHAAHLWYGLSTVYPDVNILQATASTCRPVLNAVGASQCTDMMKFIYNDFLPNHHVDKLLLAGRWLDQDMPDIGRTVAWAKEHGIEVMVFGPAVEYDAALPRLLAVSLTKNDPDFPYHHLLPATQKLDAKMQELAATQWKTEYVSYYQMLCQPGSCVEYASSQVPMTSDATHFTKEGSVLVAERLGEGRLLQ